MPDTHLSLFDRIQDGLDSDGWTRLVELYQPLLLKWLREWGLPEQDADDLMQEVFTTLAQELPQFQHSGRTGAFRAWLRKVLLNRLRAHHRREKKEALVPGGTPFGVLIQGLEDPDSVMSSRWDREHDVFIAASLLKSAESRFQPKTWRIFQLLVFEDQSPDYVASTLETSLNSVFIARSRVLSFLRQQAHGVIA
jgi:RNA polymerase sigma-70 factor (ECF subfamily)